MAIEFVIFWGTKDLKKRMSCVFFFGRELWTQVKIVKMKVEHIQ